MAESKRFNFQSAEFKSDFAHGGSKSILFCRASTLSDGHSYNFLDLTIVPPRADIGIHTHEHNNEEIYVVISGSGLMFLDGMEFEVGAGDVVVNRPGGTHGLRNIGETDLKIVVVEIPISL